MSRPSDSHVTHAFHNTRDTRPHPPHLPERFHCFLQWPFATWIPPEQDNCNSCWGYAVSRAFGARLTIASGGAISNLLQTDEIAKLWTLSRTGERMGPRPPSSKRVFLSSVSRDLRRFLLQGMPIGSPLDLSVTGESLADWLGYYGDRSIYLDERQLMTETGCRPHSLFEAWTKVFEEGMKSYPVPLGPFYCTSPRRLPELDTHAIMQEIFERGPVTSGMAVYDDFRRWRPGPGKVYRPSKSHLVESLDAGHAVCIVGWIPGAWVVSNSWGMDWGMSTISRDNARFKGEFLMERGTNTAGIEENVVVSDAVV